MALSIPCQHNRIPVNVSLTLDMEKRLLNISLNYNGNYGKGYYTHSRHRNQSSTNYHVTGKQVSPYFSTSSSRITLSIVE